MTQIRSNLKRSERLKRSKEAAKNYRPTKNERRKKLCFNGTDNYGIADLELMAEELDAWSLLDDSIRLYDFPLSIGLTPNKFHYYRERNENLNYAWQKSRARIASRREKLALFHKANAHIILSTAPIYDDEYRAWLREKNEAKNQESKTIVAVIERFPETDVVAKKSDTNIVKD